MGHDSSAPGGVCAGRRASRKQLGHPGRWGRAHIDRCVLLLTHEIHQPAAALLGTSWTPCHKSAAAWRTQEKSAAAAHRVAPASLID